MSRSEYFWPGPEYSAIQIKAGRCNINIEGNPDDRIAFNGNLDNNAVRNLIVDSGGGWLFFDFRRQHNDFKLNLKLPVNKTWTLKISTAKGDINLRNIRGGCQALLGNGSLGIENCRGQLTLMTGKGDIKIKNFQQVDIPEAPPVPKDLSQSTPFNDEQDKISEQEVGWEIEDMGSKLMTRVANSKRFWNIGSPTSPERGLNLKVIRGDVQLDEVEFERCSINAARGDLKIQKGRCGFLEGDLHKGNIEIDSALGGMDWNLATHHGNIRLALAADVAARMDIATRLGDIRSEIPLVKVARKGPLSCYNNRMVGLLGQDKGGQIAVLRLSTVHGNIEIKTQSKNQEYLVPSRSSASPNPAGEVTDRPSTSQANIPELTVKAYKNTFAVLQALSTKRITIDEADRLLRDFSDKNNK